MKNFLAYFSYYMMPNTAIFTILSSIYFLLSYSLDASIKLGIIYGFIISIFISTILSIVAMSKKTMQTYASKQQELREKEKKVESIKPIEKSKEVEVEVEKVTIIENIPEQNEKKEKDKEITLFLLMNENLAFDILVQIVVENDTWNIEARDKDNNTITIITPHQNIYISVQTLTRNTSKIEIKTDDANNCFKTLITNIKEKEHSFLEY